MRALPPVVRLYVGLTYLAAAVLVAVQVAPTLLSAAGSPWTHTVLVDALIFAALAYFGEHTMLQVGPSVDQSLSTPVHIAAILILPAPFPTLITAGSVAVSQLLTRHTPLYKRAYNVARTTLLVGLVTVLFSRATIPTELLEHGRVLAAGPHLALLLGLYYVLDVGLLLTLLALLQRRPPWQVWWTAYRHTVIPEIAAAATGILVAAVWRYDHLLLALFLIPVLALRLAFRAIARAEDAQRVSEERRQAAEEAHRDADAARQAAERAVRVRDHFLISAAHDLRTPLTAIRGRGDVLQHRLAGDNLPPAEWMRTQVDAVRDATRRMVSTVEEITDVAELQIGQTLELRMAPLELGALVRGATELVVAAVGRRRVADLRLDSPTSVLVEGDHARLERVVQNILGNALKYSGEGEPVEVTVGVCGAEAVVTVVDHGVGIPADELPLIFTHFYRASTARGIAGTGLGLAGSKAIVEQHGGAIAVASTVGEGTTVTVRLPRVLSA